MARTWKDELEAVRKFAEANPDEFARIWAGMKSLVSDFFASDHPPTAAELAGKCKEWADLEWAGAVFRRKTATAAAAREIPAAIFALLLKVVLACVAAKG